MRYSSAGSRAEHYVIAAYTGLITMAQATGERDAVATATRLSSVRAAA
jgi:ferritin-like metal-binding protein YciE